MTDYTELVADAETWLAEDWLLMNPAPMVKSAMEMVQSLHDAIERLVAEREGWETGTNQWGQPAKPFIVELEEILTWKARAEKAEAALLDQASKAENIRLTFFQNAEAWETKCNASWTERDFWKARAEKAEAALKEIIKVSSDGGSKPELLDIARAALKEQGQ